MKKLILSFIIACVLINVQHIAAQPFSLDDSIEPIQLSLVEDNRPGFEGYKGIVLFNRINSSSLLHTVSGHGIFDPVDVFVTSITGAPLKATIVYNNWNDVQFSETTSSKNDGIVNFKLRAYGAFGIKVETANPNEDLYSIAVVAGQAQRNYLNSPFNAIQKSEIKASSKDASSGQSSNILLLTLLLVAVLIIGILAGKLLFKNKASLLLVFILMSFNASNINTYSPVIMNMQEFENYKNGQKQLQERILRNIGVTEAEHKAFKNAVNSIYSSTQKNVSMGKSSIEFWKRYKALGDCMSSSTPPGMPSIPSFCIIEVEDENSVKNSTNDCAACFLEARKEFNTVRYLFEELAAIYGCTKKFADAAISFGDNVSGIHAVSGLTWQYERQKIQKSVSDLERAYDDKYLEFLERLANVMEQLNKCEAQYGVEDWYDRFGYMYFEFIKDKYAR